MGKFLKKMPEKLPENWLIGGMALILTAVLVASILLSGASSPEIQQTQASTQAALPPLREKPYNPWDFYYLGNFLSCLGAYTVPGIDVSCFQEDIRWEEVAKAGIEFAMVRIGYRGYMEGVLEEDPTQAENRNGARAAGIDVGVYFFTQAVSVEEAVEEARFVLHLLDGWELDLPVVFDWEYISPEARTANVTPETLNACALAFCREIESRGYDAMVYFNPHLAEDYYRLEELTEYGFWLAHYSDEMTFPYAVDLWQYTNQGTVPGIDTPVDVNLAFGSLYEG